jgi:hypothetical protein
MNALRILNTAALAAALATLTPRPALAVDFGCAPMNIEIAPDVRVRWPEAAVLLRQALAGREDIDTCAHVKLEWIDGAFALKVALPDGRSTTRSVQRQEDVVPTAEALLLVPRRSAPTPESSTSTPPREGPLAINLQPPTADRDEAGPVARPPSRVRFELGAETVGSIGDGQAGAGFGVLSFLELRGWLVGVQGRANYFQALTGGGREGALEVAGLAGRRVRFGALALDVTAGPGFAVQPATATVITQTRSNPGDTVSDTDSHVSAGIAPRLLIGARLNFRARSSLRTFVGVDADLGGTGDDVPNLSRIPGWTAGLAVGAAMETM